MYTYIHMHIYIYVYVSIHIYIYIYITLWQGLALVVAILGLSRLWSPGGLALQFAGRLLKQNRAVVLAAVRDFRMQALRCFFFFKCIIFAFLGKSPHLCVGMLEAANFAEAWGSNSNSQLYRRRSAWKMPRGLSTLGPFWDAHKNSIAKRLTNPSLRESGSEISGDPSSLGVRCGGAEG